MTVSQVLCIYQCCYDAFYLTNIRETDPPAVTVSRTIRPPVVSISLIQSYHPPVAAAAAAPNLNKNLNAFLVKLYEKIYINLMLNSIQLEKITPR
jgi:hypothetical protein